VTIGFLLLVGGGGVRFARTLNLTSGRMDRPGVQFPAGFFDRFDEQPDAVFYAPPRLVTHIDDGAIAGVGRLYEHLGLDGEVLDLMSSWVSHFRRPPARLTVLGMNAVELARNPMAAEVVVHDLNAEPHLPFDDESFDAVTCCVSVDYLTRPVEVFADVARVLRAGGLFVCTFSNRCFPTKAIKGWLANDDLGRLAIVRAYFDQAEAFDEPTLAHCNPGEPGDPLYGAWAAAR
jgi:SAM-dependent methyltransferase